MSANRFLLDPQSLTSKVSAATFERGLAVYRNQQVLEDDGPGVATLRPAQARRVEVLAHGSSVVPALFRDTNAAS